MSELKPCPFCPDGGNPRYITGGSREHSVRCSKCLVIGPIRGTEAEAIEAWNTRHEETCEGCKFSDYWCEECSRNYCDFYTPKEGTGGNDGD